VPQFGFRPQQIFRFQVAREPEGTRVEGGAKSLFPRQRMPLSFLDHLTIVIVEDHDDTRGYLTLFLRRSGANVIATSNGFEGFVAIKNSHPDLVLADITMPGMDGFELLRQVRALGPEAGGNVPILGAALNLLRALVCRPEHIRCFFGGFREDVCGF
jgi:PleD family two-component response regulator